MKIRILTFLTLLAGFLSSELYAFSLKSSEIKLLSEHSTWHKLLLLEQDDRSKLTDKTFYLDQLNQKNNVISKDAELRATLNAFSKPIRDPNKHPLCVFSARRIWLAEMLPEYREKLLGFKCADYDNFTRGNSINSVSVIFATGYLGNPASYYGHILLKLNMSEKGKLHDPAINFGADVLPEDDMLSYIVKGLAGGYQSSFTSQAFFYHLQNYGENELRDLWEYKLRLNKHQKAIFIAHLWEVLNRDITYYFLNKNCAYFMADVLDFITPMPISQSWSPWVAPQTVIQQLIQQQPSIVESKAYHPSRQSRLYQRYQGLNATEREKLIKIAHQPEALLQSVIDSLPLKSQQNVLDTLLDYFQYLREPNLKEKDPNNRYYNRVLSLRFQLPPGKKEIKFESDNEPDLGRKLSRTSLGIIQQSNQLSALINLRPAYYDSLDATYGHTPHAALSMGEAELIIRDEKVKINELKLVEILSINPNYTLLPGDVSHSWYLSIGAKQKLENQKLASFINTAYGFAHSFGRGQLNVSGFIGAGFHDDKLTSDGLFVNATTMINSYVNESWSWNIKMERRHYKSKKEQLFDGSVRYVLNEHLDTRFTLSFDNISNSSTIGIEAGWYW